jgi:hypothetical protein
MTDPQALRALVAELADRSECDSPAPPWCRDVLADPTCWCDGCLHAVAAALLAQEAPVYTRAEFEHDRMGETGDRLAEREALEVKADVRCVCGHAQDSHGHDGSGPCGATKACRAGGCRRFSAASGVAGDPR